MDATRWQTLQLLFHEALGRPPAARQAYLARASDDPTLIAEVQAMIEADQGADSPLDRDLGAMASDVFRARPLAPRHIGPYRLGDVLGEGGMGVVYLGERDDIGGRAAIKVLRDAALSPARRARFEREERILARLDHPAIARLFDAAVLPDGTPYVVMELVDGIPITDYCVAQRCSIDARLRLFRDVCRAVAHAHRQAVVHRDIKPSNVLVAEGDGGEARVKLLDFGIATTLDDLDVPAGQTVTGLRLMTPAYAAPEQLRGDPVGVYTDVYALGVLLYEVLSETRPFDPTGRSPGEVEAQILSRDPAPPSTRATGGEAGARLGRRAWADLDVLCLTAMHKDPDRRYATVEALLRDLDHFLAGEPLEARPDAIGYRAGMFLRRNRQWVTVAAVGLVAALVLAVVSTLRIADARDRALAEADKAEAVSGYLIGLFDANDPFAAGADSLTVEALLTRGAARAEDLADQPEAQAEMFDALGRVHLQLGQYATADTLLRRALALRQRRADRPLDLAETLLHLGSLRYQQSELDEAERWMRKAVALQEAHLPAHHPDLARTLNELGSLLTDRGEYDAAEALYLRALRIQRAAHRGPHEDLAVTLGNLGVNHYNQQDLDAAGRYYRQALDATRAVFEPDHPRVALATGNLAMVSEARGDFAVADSMMTEDLRIRRARLGDDHFYTAYGLVALGNLTRKMEAFDRSEGYLREAVETHSRTLGVGHLNTLVARNQLALTLRDRREYREAAALLRGVSQAFRERLGEGHYYSASSACQLGEVLFLEGKASEAANLYAACLPHLVAALPRGHPSAALHESRYGEVLAAEKRFAEAEPLLRDSYEALYETYGRDHRSVGDAARRLAELYSARGRPEVASAFRALPEPTRAPR